jgi:peptide deformylase
VGILSILEFPDPRLRTVAEPVKVVDKAIKNLVDDMLETMYEAHHQTPLSPSAQ